MLYYEEPNKKKKLREIETTFTRIRIKTHTLLYQTKRRNRKVWEMYTFVFTIPGHRRSVCSSAHIEKHADHHECFVGE